jgi:hypothetical protein
MMMTLIEMFLEICIYQSKAKDHDEQAQAREMRGRVIENPALHNEKQLFFCRNREKHPTMNPMMFQQQQAHAQQAAMMQQQ